MHIDRANVDLLYISFTFVLTRESTLLLALVLQPKIVWSSYIWWMKCHYCLSKDCPNRCQIILDEAEINKWSVMLQSNCYTSRWMYRLTLFRQTVASDMSIYGGIHMLMSVYKRCIIMMTTTNQVDPCLPLLASCMCFRHEICSQ